MTLPLAALGLATVATSLLRELPRKSAVRIALPDAIWQKVSVGVYGLVALTYPGFQSLWGGGEHGRALAGTGVVPTLMIAGLCLALTAPPRYDREGLLLVAVLIAASDMWTGHRASVVLVPLALSLGYRLVRAWAAARRQGGSLRLQDLAALGVRARRDIP